MHHYIKQCCKTGLSDFIMLIKM